MTALDQNLAPAAGRAAAPRGDMVSRVAANSAWLICQPLLLNVISVLSTGYIARSLGAADYGAFNLGFAQIALFSPLGNLGLRAVAVRAIAEDREHAREIVGATFALRLLFTALAALLALLWLCLPTYSWTTRAIGLAAIGSMVFQSMGMVAVDLFQGFERARPAAQAQMLGGLLLTLLSVLALLAGLELPGFVGACVLGAFLQMALLHSAARRHFQAIRPCFDRQRIRALFHQLRPFMGLSLLSSLTDAPVVDVLILGALYPAGAVGAYAAANGLVGRLLMVPLGIGDALYPAVAHGHSRDSEEVRHAVRSYVSNLVLVTLPIALWLTFAAPTVLWILFGNQYDAGVPVLRLAGWLLPLTGFAYLVRECLSAIRRQDEALRLSLVSGGLVVALYAVLIPAFGLVGAAVAGIAREVVMLPLWLRALSRRFSNPVPWPRLGAVLIAAGAMAVPLLPLLLRYDHTYAVIGSALAWLAYAGAAVNLGLVDPRILARVPGAGCLVRADRR
jgi:O-antigen/teichoic acid export membrane protein